MLDDPKFLVMMAKIHSLEFRYRVVHEPDVCAVYILAGAYQWIDSRWKIVGTAADTENLPWDHALKAFPLAIDILKSWKFRGYPLPNS